MRTPPKPRFMRARAMKQRGVVLFFALIALLAMSLAAVALIRSVDTSTMIAGNLAFKQSATSSGDAGIEAAMTWLVATQTANKDKSVLNDPTHAFNFDNFPAGYYSSLNPALSLTDGTGIQWDDTGSALVLPDPNSGGNTIRYIIQRVCRTANALPSTLEQPLAVPPKTDCLFSSANDDPNPQHLRLPQEVCSAAGCPLAGQSPQVRITARTTGPKNTVSYVQTFVY